MHIILARLHVDWPLDNMFLTLSTTYIHVGIMRIPRPRHTLRTALALPRSLFDNLFQTLSTTYFPVGVPTRFYLLHPWSRAPAVLVLPCTSPCRLAARQYVPDIVYYLHPCRHHAHPTPAAYTTVALRLHVVATLILPCMSSV